MGIPTYDIETVGWSIPISVGFYDGSDYYEFLKENEEDDVIWKFLTFLRKFVGIKLYAHCASKFDNKFILASLLQHDEEIALEAGLAKLKWVSPNVSFEDSYLLVPMSLERAAKMFKTSPKETWNHDKNLKPWEMGSSLVTFRQYQKMDCITLSEIMYKLSEMLGGIFGSMPSITISTTAAKIFDKCFYNLRDVNSNEEFEIFIRRATYGGRNEVYKRYGENINSYDVRDMYTSCYDTPVPIGRLRWIRPNIDKGTLAEAFVKVPKDRYIGPLPYRLNRRLIFPVGEFQDWWDIVDLRNAAKLGVDISIRRQLCADEEPILKDFGELASRLKRESDMSRFWKIFGLSLSGKFGQSRWRDILRHYKSITDFTGYFPIDKDEIYFQTKEYTSGTAPYIKPAITMRVRAEARVRHLNYLLEANNKGDIYYDDTDSVFTSADMSTGESSGELQFLGKSERGYFIRQKLYALVREGKLIQRSAGYSDLKLKEGDFVHLLEGGEVEVAHNGFSLHPQIFNTKELKWLERSSTLRVSEDSNRISEGSDSRPIQLPLEHL